MPDDPKLVDEINKMECEPLLPAEKKLIVASLMLGLLLLGMFVAFAGGTH